MKFSLISWKCVKVIMCLSSGHHLNLHLHLEAQKHFETKLWPEEKKLKSAGVPLTLVNYSLLEVTDSQGFRVPRPWRCVFLEVLVSPCASRTAELAGELADVRWCNSGSSSNRRERWSYPGVWSWSNGWWLPFACPLLDKDLKSKDRETFEKFRQFRGVVISHHFWIALLCLLPNSPTEVTKFQR